MENQEIWKSIKNGHEGVYESSDKGGLRKINNGKIKLLKGRVNKGYFEYSIRENGKQRYLKGHQLVAMAFLNHIPCGHDLVVDHINFDKLDNRPENLRIVTQRENTNHKHIKSSSSYTGVSFEKSTNKWRACIGINKRVISIGRYKTEIEASNAYEARVLELAS